MTIYCIYITASDEIFKILKKRMVLSYTVPKKYFENGDVSSLYAWTDSKKYSDEFMSIHKEKYFSIIKKNITKKMYKKFELDYSHIKLERYEYVYNFNEDKIKIISTFEENSSVTLNFAEFKYEILSEVVDINVAIFKAEYINALSLLEYTTEYYIRQNDFDETEFIFEEFYQRMDDADSFRRRIVNNEFGLYTFLFKDILKN